MANDASPQPRVAFVLPNPRAELAVAVAAGTAPDSTLLGQNHLGALGIDARLHDPLLTRRRVPGGLLGRVAWSLRELTLPWELRDADLAFTALANLFPLAARARRRPPVVVVNYGLCLIYERSSGPRRRLLAASLRSAAAVVCLARSQRDQLMEQTGLPPERVHVVPLGIDERYFAPRAAPAQGEPYVLAVGKDMARDYETFARAVERLGVRAEIAAYPRNLEGVRLPPGTRARAVPPGELRELYAGAACVVVPQRRDGYPYGSEGGGLTALLEALAMARPVVASDRAVLHDYVVDGVSALLVAPEDPDALAAGISRVLDDPATADSLGGAGRARVEEALTSAHFAAGIAPILVAAARNEPAPRRVRAQQDPWRHDEFGKP